MCRPLQFWPHVQRQCSLLACRSRVPYLIVSATVMHFRTVLTPMCPADLHTEDQPCGKLEQRCLRRHVPDGRRYKEPTICARAEAVLP